MATSPTDRSVKDEEEEVRTEEVDPAKISDEEDVVRTEENEERTQEEEVRTEEEEVKTEEVDLTKEEAIESLVDSARNLSIEDEESNQETENQNRQEDPITVDSITSDEEDDVRTEEDVVQTEEDVVRTEENEVQTEEEEVKTEEVDLAKTTEEAEDEVRTEEDVVKTEEDEVRTEEDVVRTEKNEVQTEEEEVKTEEVDLTKEEDENKEEANESLLDSARDLNIEDEESKQETENQNLQEDPITVTNDPSLDQTIDVGSTLLTSEQKRRIDSWVANATALSIGIQDEESDQETENQNPQEGSITVRRSDQTIERGSTSAARDQNRPRVRYGAQVSQQMMMPPHLGPYQQDPFGLPQPRWLVVDHFYTDGLGLYGALWRFRTISTLLPYQNVSAPLWMMELPNQPGLVLVRYTQSFGSLQPPLRPPMMQQQNQLVPHVPRAPPMMQPPYVLTGHVPVRVEMEQNQIYTYLLPTNQEQNQDQIVYNVVIGQAPVRPPMMQHDQMFHSLRQFDAPLMQPPVMFYSPRPIVNTVPVRRPMMNYNNNQRQQRFRLPNAAARLEEVNQQRQSQTEQSRQSSQGSNDGPSSSSGESEG